MNTIKLKTVIKRLSILIALIWFVWFINCLPKKAFEKPISTVLLSSEGELLGARIAEDGQWRFSAVDTVPHKFKVCITEFEDRSFYSHPGVSIKGIARALKQNLSNGKVVSGGSTITMQVARLMRGKQTRNIKSKFIEMNMALRMELRFSKEEILNLYASNAPFGNNVVGLEAASWRYFSRPSGKLSWAESATLAVLPNAPGLIYPGKNHDALLAKRNRLLKRLYDRGILNKTTYQLSLLEALPSKPLPLPEKASHLLEKLIKEGKKGKTITSTINLSFQEKVEELLSNRMIWLSDNKIYNSALMVTETKTGRVIAYIGNSLNKNQTGHSEQVDCVMSPRSTGSILKPILYAKAIEDGLITPEALLYDVPSYFNGFSPKNFNYKYDGLVHADEALSRSLNIPFVRLLGEYGYEKFYHDLKDIGIQTLSYPASHYGLSIILGGAEARLWDLNTVYQRMGAELIGKGVAKVHVDSKDTAFDIQNRFTKASLFATFDAMTNLGRPDEEGNWMLFDEKKKIAWKTGTSFGFRDAWAIGVTPDYTVSVWVGNADGEGRPGLTGIKAAAPILFDVFRQLPEKSTWFKEPISEMRILNICGVSGQRAGKDCEEVYKRHVPATCLETVACSYHKQILLDKTGKYRVDCECESPFEIQKKSWLVIAPGIEKYYKLTHPEYSPLPVYRSDCIIGKQEKPIHILYPRPGTKIRLSKEVDGKIGSALFELAHRQSGIKIYWHLDENYIGETSELHQMKIVAEPGLHKLLVMDENGMTQSVDFEVVL